MSARGGWKGSARLGSGWALFRGQAGDNQPHRHHAVQLVVGQREVSVQSGGRLFTAPALLIGADCLHQLQASRFPVWAFYADRVSASGRSLHQLSAGQVLRLNRAAEIRSLLGKAHAEDLDQQVAALLTGENQALVQADARIEAALLRLRGQLQAPPSLVQAARQAGLSAGRFGHLFRAHCGMPLRPYLRWLRLQQALQLALGGASLTEAAHGAGFADSAHLSRTCRRAFGITPQHMAALLRA